MKQGIHPDYREVVFQDEDAGFAFLTRSTIKTNETIQWEDGNEYPLVKLCLLYTSPSPRDRQKSRMPSSA